MNIKLLSIVVGGALIVGVAAYFYFTQEVVIPTEAEVVEVATSTEDMKIAPKAVQKTESKPETKKFINRAADNYVILSEGQAITDPDQHLTIRLVSVSENEHEVRVHLTAPDNGAMQTQEVTITTDDVHALFLFSPTSYSISLARTLGPTAEVSIALMPRDTIPDENNSNPEVKLNFGKPYTYTEQ